MSEQEMDWQKEATYWQLRYMALCAEINEEVERLRNEIDEDFDDE